MLTFQRICQDLEAQFVVKTFDKFSEMSAWLGQHYHPFDELLCSEFRIPDLISFIRAGNPVFGTKMGIGNRGFGTLCQYQELKRIALNWQSLCTKTTMSIQTIQNTMHGIDILDGMEFGHGMEIGQIQTHCIQDCRVRPIVANKKVALSPLGRNEYEKRR